MRLPFVFGGGAVVTTDDRIARVANNSLLLLFSRLAMAATPFIASMLVYLGGFYLEARFDQSRNSIADLNSRVQAVQVQADKAVLAIVDLNKQIALTNQAVSSDGQTNLAWRTTMNARLDKLTDAVSALAVAASSLTATVQQLNR